MLIETIRIENNIQNGYYQKKFMKKTFRKDQLGALLDEYERACDDLKRTIADISIEEFTAIIDKETEDPDCVSIQTIMSHTVNAGYGYVFYIRKKFDDPNAVRERRDPAKTPAEACDELDKMIAYTEKNLSNKYSLTFEEIIKNEFKVPWGQCYDFEQMLEHAIVHILRHRRQIERFLIKYYSLNIAPHKE